MDLTGRTLLITGGAGFIGSEVTQQALQLGARAVVVDNLATGRAENLPDHDDLDLHVGDVRDQALMADLCREADTVLHLACLGVRHSLHSPVENHEVNATATLGLLEAARQAGVTRFVYVSTSEVYGTARWAPMAEDHPTFVKTVYGGSKLAGESYTRAYHDAFGLSTTVVRPFNTYGPNCHHEGDSGEVIPKFLLRSMAGLPMIVFGDGHQTRDFSHVSDTARGILLAASADGVTGETINLGFGSEITVNELAQVVAEVTGSEPDVIHDHPRPGDVLRLCADASKADALLGYRPEVPLREGLRRLHEWYEASPHSAEELLEAEIPRNWEAPSSS